MGEPTGDQYELPPLPKPDPPPGPRLERQMEPGAAKRFGRGGAGCLGVSTLTFFLTGLQYVAMGGYHTASGLFFFLTAAGFAAATATALRGWVWTTLALVAAAFCGPPMVLAAGAWVVRLF